MTNPVPLPVLIGSRVRTLRESRGLRQEEIASGARNLGFDWSRGAVAMIESGRRRLTLEEFLALPQILENVGAGDLWLEDVLPSEGLARLTPQVAVPVIVLRAMLRGEARLGREFDLVPVTGRDLLALEATRDIEQKAAASLGVDPMAIAKAAHKLWGRGLGEEREKRLGADRRLPDEMPRRSLQALRGHVTRQLLDELRPVVKGKGRRSR